MPGAGFLFSRIGATVGKVVLAHYPLSKFSSPDLAFAQVLTDSEFSCPARAGSRGHVRGAHQCAFWVTIEGPALHGVTPAPGW